jgi:hypothetical protein
LQHAALHIVSYLPTLSQQAVFLEFTEANMALKSPDLK